MTHAVIVGKELHVVLLADGRDFFYLLLMFKVDF